MPEPSPGGARAAARRSAAPSGRPTRPSRPGRRRSRRTSPRTRRAPSSPARRARARGLVADRRRRPRPRRAARPVPPRRGRAGCDAGDRRRRPSRRWATATSGAGRTAVPTRACGPRGSVRLPTACRSARRAGRSAAWWRCRRTRCRSVRPTGCRGSGGIRSAHPRLRTRRAGPGRRSGRVRRAGGPGERVLVGHGLERSPRVCAVGCGLSAKFLRSGGPTPAVKRIRRDDRSRTGHRLRTARLQPADIVPADPDRMASPARLGPSSPDDPATDADSPVPTGRSQAGPTVRPRPTPTVRT